MINHTRSSCLLSAESEGSLHNALETPLLMANHRYSSRSTCGGLEAIDRAEHEEQVDKAEWQEFGEWVETLRTRAGLQVNELASRAGVSAMWLQEMRRGGRNIYGQWRLPNPKNEALARLARALEVPVEDMLSRAGRGPGPYIGDTSTPADAEDRIKQLEERVVEHERVIAEMRRRLEEGWDEQADAR